LAAKNAKNAKEKQSNPHRATLQMRTQHWSSVSLPALAFSIHLAAECGTTAIFAGIAFGSHLATESGS
jgi:hypothetical protein